VTRISYISPSGRSLTLGEGRILILGAEGLEAPQITAIVAGSPALGGYGDLSAQVGTRKVSIQAAIDLSGLDANAARELLSSVGLSLVPEEGLGTLRIERSGRTRLVEALPNGAPHFGKRRWDSPFRSLELGFSCASPWFRESTTRKAEVRYYATRLSFPEAGIAFPEEGLAFSTLECEGTRSVTIENSGDVPAPVRIRFTGPTVNPFVANRTTGEEIRILDALAQDEWMDIDTTPGKRKVTITRGGVEGNGMQYLDLSSTFWKLRPGTNLVELGDESPGEGSEASLEFEFLYASA
jgi:hypothetical protein